MFPTLQPDNLHLHMNGPMSTHYVLLQVLMEDINYCNTGLHYNNNNNKLSISSHIRFILKHNTMNVCFWCESSHRVLHIIFTFIKLFPGCTETDLKAARILNSLSSVTTGL